MSDSIFFSWQSDVDEAVTKAVIRKAIRRAIKGVNREIDLQDAAREILEYDADTMGETGNPSVIDTICSKIDSAAAFVADVTYVATVKSDDRTKGLPNANVMIEYGYALKTLHNDKAEARKKTILIMNTAFGKPPKTELPFDLNHLRWPIQFDLSPGATDEAKDKAVNYLAGVLKDNLRKLCKPPETRKMPIILLKSVSQDSELISISRCDSMNELFDKKIRDAKTFNDDIQIQPDYQIAISRGSSRSILNGSARAGSQLKRELQTKTDVYEQELERLKLDPGSYTNFRQKQAVDCHLAISNPDNVTLSNVLITIQLPEWLIAYRANMARSLLSPLNISTQHRNWQVVGGDFHNIKEDVSHGDTVRVQFNALTFEIDTLRKRRVFDAVGPHDSFTLLALPHGEIGPNYLTVDIDAEEFDAPLSGKIEIEIV